MGIFQGKQKDRPLNENADGVQRFFDGYFKTLKQRGNNHFEKMIDEQLTHFKHDLDGTIARANTELKQYIVQQVDEEVAENDQAMKDAQQHALESISNSAHMLEEQHRQLTEALQQNASTQQAKITQAFDDHVQQMTNMKQAQEAALRTLQSSAAAIQKQQEEFTSTFAKSLQDQQEKLIGAFTDNMARVIEGYVTEAIGDQYDVKSQLPSIMKQLEANKQDIVDDLKL